VTGEIVRFAPSHLVLVDAAFFDAEPGTISVIESEKIGGVSFSTHTLPAPIILDYLQKSTGCKAVIVGIQPKSTEFMAEVSKPVLRAVEDLAEALVALFDPQPKPAQGVA